jgi:serine/threonine protein kinase
MKQIIKFSDNYKTIKKLGSGSFGEVYLAEDNSGNLYAAKVEERDKKNRLKCEYNIYKKILHRNDILGIPKIYGYLETQDYNIMIMELLGKSLENLFQEKEKCFELNVVYKLGIDIIDIIEKFHAKGFLHRDIKPNNFLFNYGSKYDQIYLMDFGLSKQYIRNGIHAEIKFDRSLIGTARYASLNVHWGLEPSRRDDIESIGYLLVYFAKGRLPWQGLKGDDMKSQIDKIGDKKIMTSLSKLCEGLPKCFEQYLEYCRNLKYEEKPDYNYLRNLFIDSANSLKLKLSYEF